MSWLAKISSNVAGRGWFAGVKELTQSACTHLRKPDEVGVRLDEYHRFYSCSEAYLSIANTLSDFNESGDAEDTTNITVLNSMETRSFSLRVLYVARASTAASTKRKTPLMEIGRMRNTVWDFTGSSYSFKLWRPRESRYRGKRGMLIPMILFTVMPKLVYGDTHKRAALLRRNYANGDASGNTRDYTLRDALDRLADIESVIRMQGKH
ncbi:hypothetical protein EAG_12394 [Camponotus floridanus]|uniref:Uncharacterized protein n=1 Tax=Camponotus floridanus TaxID=104421 RepID=E2AWD1_CAMFO|nr:hypothetical protein EAG_12394 [Camponotus floridanus]